MAPKSIERLLLLSLYALDPASPPASTDPCVKTGPERQSIDFIRLVCGGGDGLYLRTAQIATWSCWDRHVYEGKALFFSVFGMELASTAL